MSRCPPFEEVAIERLDAPANAAAIFRRRTYAQTRQKYQGNVAAIQSPGQAALLEVAQLRARQKELLSTIPD